MEWLTRLPLGDNRPLQIAALAGIAIVAITALIIAYRALFGHRLRFSGGGKARQPRLGLVDAFSLDGQRQLVIVRRDNVEHLLMIGGPNDVVVESQIVRAQPQLQPREAAAVAAPKPPAPAQAPPQPQPSPPQPPPQPQAPIPMKAVAAPTVSPLRPATPPGPAAIPTPTRAPIRPEPPAQAKAAPSAPPQSTPPAAPTFGPKPQPGGEAGESRAPAKPSVLPLRSSNPAPRSSLPPPIVVSGGPSAPPAPPKPTTMPAPPIAPSQKAANPPPPPQSGADAKGDPFAGLDSLEAEMARLLGREP
jgi:flagellar protein FliO/FliZ